MLTGSIILAGGQSRRMGRPKELLPFGDTSLLARVVDVMMDNAHPVVVVARDEQQALPPLPLELDVIFDDHPGDGPLAGIATGMRRIQGTCDAVVVVASDMPFLAHHMVAWLTDRLANYDLVMPKAGGALQPLAALYHMRLLPKIEAVLATGEKSPKAMVDHCNSLVLEEPDVRKFDPTLKFLTRVNTEAEYQAALAQLG